MKPTCSHCKSEKLVLVKRQKMEWDFVFDEVKQEWVPEGWDNAHDIGKEKSFIFCKDCKRKMLVKAFEKKQGEIIFA